MLPLELDSRFQIYPVFLLSDCTVGLGQGDDDDDYRFFFYRIGWLICCCTSTCCAGLLCIVLWERFLEVPAVLELWDLQLEETSYQHMPLVAICPPVDASASLLVNHL